jgi:hypothetical protein
MEKEAIEEAAKKIYPTHKGLTTIASNKIMLRRTAFIKGAKWQAERMYSEEDMREAFIAGTQFEEDYDYNLYMEKWFEQFKKK